MIDLVNHPSDLPRILPGYHFVELVQSKTLKNQPVFLGTADATSYELDSDLLNLAFSGHALSPSENLSDFLPPLLRDLFGRFKL